MQEQNSLEAEIKIEENKAKELANEIVPGLVTGASDNDPAGIATYALSGIRFGYSQLWIMVLATPMLVAVQSMAARIALVTKKGLSWNFSNHFSKKIAFTAVGLMLVANVLTMGADIAAMAESITLLFPNTEIVFWVVPISFIMWYVLVFFNYKQIRKYFLWLILVFAAFAISAIMSNPNWSEVFKNTFIPHISFNKMALISIVALMGTTISPYLIFWEARETIEEKVPKRFAKLQNIIQAPGFILSNIVSYMIIVATGTLLFNPNSPDVTASQVAQALEPVAGPYSAYLFAIGILGAGFLSVPILAASSASAISGLYEWKEGLSINPMKAKGYYQVISISMLIGVQIAIMGFDPLKALFYSQFVTGLLMPPLILLLLILANKKSVMGEYTNKWFDNLFGSLAFILLLLSAVGALIYL